MRYLKAFVSSMSAAFSAVGLTVALVRRRLASTTTASNNAKAWRAFRSNVSLFGATADGVEVEAVKLRNKHTGMTATVLQYGATIQSLTVPLPQHKGSFGKVLDADVMLGFDTLAEYEAPANPYFGCVVGPTAGRIEGGAFTLDSIEHSSLAQNDGCGETTNLHGGPTGFSNQVWIITAAAADETSVTLTHTAAEGTGGYPSSVEASVIYTLTDEGELKIEYEWTNVGDRDATVVNPTNHSYFNLSSHSPLIADSPANSAPLSLAAHTMQLMANRMVETREDGTGLPTGRLLDIRSEDTATMRGMDLRYPHLVDDKIAEIAAVQPHWPHGDAMVVDRVARPGQTTYEQASTFELCGILYSAISNLTMTVHTTAPVIQLYYSTFLGVGADGETPEPLLGKKARTYGKHGAICFEAQGFTDEVNTEYRHAPEDEAVVVPPWRLAPGESHVQTTAYRFRVGAPAGHAQLVV